MFREKGNGVNAKLVRQREEFADSEIQDVGGVVLQVVAPALESVFDRRKPYPTSPTFGRRGFFLVSLGTNLVHMD